MMHLMMHFMMQLLLCGLDGASAELGEGDQGDGGKLLNAPDLTSSFLK